MDQILFTKCGKRRNLMSKSWQKILILLSCLPLMATICEGEKSLKKEETLANTAFAHAEMTLTSSAFAHGEKIPSIHTCDGQDQSPPLTWKNVPSKTVSLALVMDDPDAPGGTFVHWVAWNIDPKKNGLPGQITSTASEDQLMQGNNS